MKNPIHCGEEMKYKEGRVKTLSGTSTKIITVFQCKTCKHEEIITTVHPYSVEDFLKGLRNLNEIMEKQGPL